MDDFLSLKDAAVFSGRSESTLKRLIAKVLDEHEHDQLMVDQIIKKRQAAKGYFWFISKRFLVEEFALGESMNDHDRPSDRPNARDGEPMDDQVVGQRTLESEILSILKEQLRVKDEQIKNFQERDKEHNILINRLQERVFLLEEAKPEYRPEYTQEHVFYQNEPEQRREEGGNGGFEAAATGADRSDENPSATRPPEEKPAEGQQEQVETSERAAATDPGWAAPEVLVRDERLAAVAAMVTEQMAAADPPDGQNGSIGLPEVMVTPPPAAVQPPAEAASPGAERPAPAGWEGEASATVAAAPAGGGQGAGEGSAAHQSPVNGQAAITESSVSAAAPDPLPQPAGTDGIISPQPPGQPQEVTAAAGESTAEPAGPAAAAAPQAPIGSLHIAQAPVMPAPVGAAQAAGQGSVAAPQSPAKKKGFWRRVFGG